MDLKIADKRPQTYDDVSLEIELTNMTKKVVISIRSSPLMRKIEDLTKFLNLHYKTRPLCRDLYGESYGRSKRRCELHSL